MYKEKNYDSLLGVQGFSDDLLKNHFKLYQGYVANTNKVIEKMNKLEKGTPEHSELKRRFGWEFNGMRLHELYFGNMTKDANDVNVDGALFKKIGEEFGSYEAWEEDFKNTGALRGIGWAILAHDIEGDRLFNIWINEHDVGHLAGATPLLIMDVFEHAFVLDFGMDRKAYIDAFWNAVDWEEVEKRLK